MENENKNAQQKHSGNKHHFPKRKSYFIEPPAQSAEQPTQRDSAAIAPQGQAQGQPATASHNNEKNVQKPQNNRPHRHTGDQGGNRNGQRDKIQGGTNDELKQDRTPQGAAGQQATNDSNAPEHKNKSNKRRNKNKHKNKQAEQGKDNARAIETAHNNSAPQKGQPAEGSRSQKKRYERPSTKPSALPIEDINDADYEKVSFPSISDDADTSASIATTVATEKKPVPMIEVVGIRFKSTGKVYYFDPKKQKLSRGQHAIVETARGQEYGEVAMGNTMVKESDTVPPLRPIIRIASPADIKHHEENKKKEDEAFAICNEKIIAHKLDMKLIDAQFTFDNSKLLFYFTSSGRVDFRDLVKDLAGVFRTRIELRQIGIRDEAKIMGGVGMCGRPLCCTLFLSDFGQVSIKMAKEQNLSLNCAKISGICGRLMCCLRYEHETYEYEIKRTPPVDSLVHTADGNGVVTEISPLRGTVKVRLAASPDNPPKIYKREDVVMLQKKHTKENTDSKDKR